MREDQSQCDQRGRLVAAAELRGPGRRVRRPDMARPSPTEIPSSMIATIPNARLANQKSWWVGSVLMTRGW